MSEQAISPRTYYADLSAMRPLHPAWGLWISDLLGLNISLWGGRVLMATASYKQFKESGKASISMWHEAQHRRQKLMHGYIRFSWRYTFSRKHRAEFEREAFEVSTAFALSQGVDVAGPDWLNYLVKALSGWRYLWMMPEVEARIWAWGTILDIVEAHKQDKIEFVDDPLCRSCGADYMGCYCAHGG